MPWRDIRAVLRAVAQHAVARLVAGLLALFGAASAVDPQVAAGLHGQTVVDAPKPSGS